MGLQKRIRAESFHSWDEPVMKACTAGAVDVTIRLERRVKDVIKPLRMSVWEEMDQYREDHSKR